MSVRSLLLAVVIVGCSPAAPPPAAEPPVPSLAEPPTVDIAASSAPAAVAAAPPADTGVATPPAPKVVVPDGACSGRALGLEDVQMQCACRADGPYRSQLPLCPGTPEGQTALVPGLVVTIELDEPRVEPGGKVRATVRFRNESEGALPLHFLRDTAVALKLLTEAGAEIPKEGTDKCVATVSLADLAGVTLAPGGEVMVKALTTATKRRHRPKECGTTAGTALPPGKYSVGIAESPLYAQTRAKPVPLEVAKK